MSVWESVTWDVARAGGFTAYILLSLAVALGLALSLKLQSNRWPRLINSEMHNFTTLLSLVFAGIHVLAVWVDPFTRFGWSEVFIPFASHYRTFWMALGIVALYLGLAIGLSTWLRPLIGYALWRRLHVMTLAVYALVTVHSIATGSDTSTGWGLLIYAISVIGIGWLLLLRWQRQQQPRQHSLRQQQPQRPISSARPATQHSVRTATTAPAAARCPSSASAYPASPPRPAGAPRPAPPESRV